jgi:hypothetical protein
VTASVDDRLRGCRHGKRGTLNDWWEEFRLYHRKDGKVVKEENLAFFAPAPGRQAACSFTKLENLILNHHTLPAKDFRFPVASRKSEFAGVLRFGRFRWPPRLDSLFLEKNYISGKRPAPSPAKAKGATSPRRNRTSPP